ncbi:hypothetical protein A0H81_00508 [Grifola frondosa]|uniref:HIT domain-containing protein n=1 Tax=Grifola frondosa TaxID=5627 RepID=A0A1C7MXA0_GRIFR|nr:hypothetical protein A0H81_00508 [Grifola frondosa]
MHEAEWAPTCSALRSNTSLPSTAAVLENLIAGSIHGLRSKTWLSHVRHSLRCSQRHRTYFPSFSTAKHEILWTDDNFTVYRETANPVSSKGHIIIVFNLHVPSLYTLSSSDLPLLVTIRDLSYRLLSTLQAPSSPAVSPIALSHPPQELLTANQRFPNNRDSFRIGFITPPFRDSKIPVTDHLHAHAYIYPADLMGWWRGVAFTSVAWYSIDDLIAEIREETSNNRIRSGMNPRPIDFVPNAGARKGTADGIETTEQGLGVADLESGELVPGTIPTSPEQRKSTSTAGSSSPGSQIPHLLV